MQRFLKINVTYDDNYKKSKVLSEIKQLKFSTEKPDILHYKHEEYRSWRFCCKLPNTRNLPPPLHHQRKYEKSI